MNKIVIFVAAVFILSVRATSKSDWDLYKEKFGKRYTTDAEETLRHNNYLDNAKRASARALLNPHAVFGDTIFSDLSAKEFTATITPNKKAIEEGLEMHRNGGFRFMQPYDAKQQSGKNGESLPAFFDWRERGAVTPIKNQQQCGSCWAFSTIGSIEGQWFLSGRNLTSFSEQNLVSCDDLISFGCHGGFSWVAYSYIINAQNGSVYSEASWPYVSGGGNVPACDVDAHKDGVAGHIDGGKLLIPWDALGMQTFIAREGPLSVAVDATSFQSYIGGVMTSCEALLVDHEVLVVGYSSAMLNATNVDYWIIKNSWGTSWGEEGYIRLQRGMNLCNVELLPNSATILPV